MTPLPIRCNAEQEAAVSAAARGHNVVVEAMAGSGKTSLVVALQHQFPDDRMLAIMYSRQLKIDTQRRFLGDEKKRNARAYTVHGFYTAYYDSEVFNEDVFADVVRKNVPPRFPFSYRFVVIDEAQDLTDFYFEALLKILSDNQHPDPVIIVLGDRLQCIYTYKGADARFLTRAHVLYRKFSGRPWTRIVLNQTYRLSVALSDFMNRVILKGPYFHSEKDGPKPIVVRGNPYKVVQRLITTGVIKIRTPRSGQANPEASGEPRAEAVARRPQDIAVLCPSVKQVSGKTPVRALGNFLSEKGVPIYFPSSDDESPDPKTLANKVLFSTYHGAKGLEKDLVIVYGAGASWYDYYGSQGECEKDCAPCCWIVALTRAKDQLIIVLDEDDTPLPFGAWEQHADAYTLINFGRAAQPEKREMAGQWQRVVSAKDLLAHQPWFELKTAHAALSIEEGERRSGISSLATIVKGNFEGTHESVSDILARTMSLWVSCRKTGKLSWGPERAVTRDEMRKQLLMDRGDDTAPLPPQNMDELVTLLMRPAGSHDINAVFRLASLIHSYEERLHRSLVQVPEKACVLDDHVTVINAAVDALGPCAQFKRTFEKLIRETKLTASVDAVDEADRGWILRFTPTTTRDQVLQAGIADYLRRQIEGKGTPATLLINLWTGERISVKATSAFEEPLTRLLANKERKEVAPISDDQFHRRVKPVVKRWAAQTAENRTGAGWDGSSAPAPDSAPAKAPQTALITKYFSAVKVRM
jgi:hypothetical protein